MAAPGEDVRGRIRAYLERRAKQDWYELWPEVAIRRAELLEALNPVTEAQAQCRPGPATWTINEIVRHHLASTSGVHDIIRDLAHGRAVREGRYDDPGDVTAHEFAPEQDLSFQGLRRQFAAGSVDFLAVVRELPEEPDFDGTFPHMYFGELNCRAWFAFQRIHDGDHLNGIRALLEHEAFPGA